MYFLTPLFNTDVFLGTINTMETLKQAAEESASRILKTYKQVGFVRSSTDCGETVGACTGHAGHTVYETLPFVRWPASS
jgi:hypothetical protein